MSSGGKGVEGERRGVEKGQDGRKGRDSCGARGAATANPPADAGGSWDHVGGYFMPGRAFPSGCQSGDWRSRGAATATMARSSWRAWDFWGGGVTRGDGTWGDAPSSGIAPRWG